MDIGISKQRFYQQQLLRIVLSVALIFAALHVAFHDLDISSNINDAEECQVCRISNVPTDLVAAPALLASLFLLSYVLIVPAFQPPTLRHQHILGARAPPLS